MIIRCPECSTGFQLPDQKITAKGTKVRCSKCSHIFRVRAGDDGAPEIFYRDSDSASESAGKLPSSPFPHAGLGLKPKKSSAFGDLSDDGAAAEADEEPLDLFDEEEPTQLIDTRPEPEPEPAPAPVQQPPAASFSPPPAAAAAAAVAAPPKKAVLPEPEEEPDEEAHGFGDASDHVDPSFGVDGPHFDPEKGKVEAPAPTKAAPATKRRHPAAGAAGPPKPAAKKAAPEPATEAAPAADTTWDDEDLAAHRIGGGPGTKIVTFLFLLCLVAFGFLGTVAALNGGFLDFKAFPQMLEVAFSDGEYEPREEWVVTLPPTVIKAPSDPLTVESVFGELVPVGRNAHVFVVRGMLRNNESETFNDVELRAMISTPEGRMRRQVGGHAGVDVPISEFRAARTVDAARDLARGSAQPVGPRALVPFTLVIDELPEMVTNGENFLLRVELAGRHANGAGSEPVAQE